MLLLGGRPEGIDGGPGIWRSTDGEHWKLVFQSGSTSMALALAAGGPGFVAVGWAEDGAAVWTSTDGLSWSIVEDPAFAGWSLREVAAVHGGLVAFAQALDGDSSSIWSSPDGRTWTRGTDKSELVIAHGIQALASYDGRAIAFAGQDDDVDGPVGVWSTDEPHHWRKVATLPKAGFVNVASGAAGGRIVDRDGTAWFSEDGQDWHGPVSGPDVFDAMIGDPAGFVVTGHVGSYGDETCGDQRPFHGDTWASADGRTWQRMRRTVEFDTAVIGALFVRDRTLIGIGGRLGPERISDAFRAARWTARLPTVAEGTSSDRPSAFQGCGG